MHSKVMEARAFPEKGVKHFLSSNSCCKTLHIDEIEFEVCRYVLN